MLKLRICVITLCLVLLAGCGTNSTKLTKYNPQLGEPTAMIIVKLENADSLYITRMGERENSANYHSEEYTINNTAFLPILFKYTDSIYPIEPGTYYISYAYKSYPNDDNFPSRSTKCPGLNAKQQPVYGAFTITADEVLYLGDIKLNWAGKDPQQLFCIKDNIVNVKDDLRKAGYAKISEKVKFAQWTH